MLVQRVNRLLTKLRRLTCLGVSAANPDSLWSDILRLLGSRKSPLLVDVGAFQGNFFKTFLRLYPSGRVVAFEPAADSAARLRDIWGADGRVRIETMALGNERCESTLIRFEHGNLNSVLPLADHDSNPFRDEKPVCLQPVTMTSLDHYCNETGVGFVDLLKVDTQGYDLKVLEGAKTLLAERRIHLLLVEVNFAFLYVGQAPPGELINFLWEFGYFPYNFHNVRRVPFLVGQGARSRKWYMRHGLRYPDNSRSPISWCDVLFCPVDLSCFR